MSRAEIQHPRKTLLCPCSSQTEIQSLLEIIWSWFSEWWNLLEILFLELGRNPPSRVPKKVVHGEVCHQRHSDTKLPEGGCGGGGGWREWPATRHFWLLCMCVARTGE